MLTVAGVVAKNNLVVDAEQKTIVNRMMVIMNKRWCSSSCVVDESHLYMMRGLLDSENGLMEPAFTVNHTGVTFNRGIFGVGTLYWHETTSYVFFASEIKALFSLKELSPKPDIKGLIENFVYWTPLCNRTAFIGVKRLECSQSVTFDSNGVNISNHPTNDSLSSIYSSEFKALSDFTSALRSQLREEIIKECKSADRVAVYLSGGLDSSILLHETSEIINDSLVDIFCLTFEDRRFDESVFQRIMAKEVNRLDDLISINIDDGLIASCIEATIADIEFPVMKLNPVSLWYLAKKVSEHGCDLILTGEGADELFWGYDFFEEEFVAQNFLTDGLLINTSNYMIEKQIGRSNLPYYLCKYHQTGDALSPLRARYENSKRIKEYLMAETDEILFSEAEKALVNKVSTIYGNDTGMRNCQWIAMTTLLPEYLVTQQSTQCIGNRQVRVCMPFLSEKMLHISYQLPEALLIDERGGKVILKETYKTDLPVQITGRKKYQLSTPGAETLITVNEELHEKYLSKSAIERHDIFRYNAVQRLEQRLRNNTASTKASTLDSLLITYILSCQILFNTAKDIWAESA